MGIFRLNADMVSVSGAVTVQRPQNFTEAPFVFKRAGRYYLQYSNGAYANNSYNVQYSTGPGPLGPWTYGGQILSATGSNNGPGHNGLLQYPGTDDWYMVTYRYQNANYSTRYTALDRMYFNADGSIQRVTMTSTGVEARPHPGHRRLPHRPRRQVRRRRRRRHRRQRRRGPALGLPAPPPTSTGPSGTARCARSAAAWTSPAAAPPTAR